MHTRNLVLLCTLVACTHPAKTPPAPTPTAAGTSSRSEPSNPQRYEEWRMQAWLDENGNPPQPDALQQARAAAKANAAFWDAEDTGGIGRYGWTERGPSNLGGRTRALLIHPTVPSRMWAGSVGGGIWRSDNTGTSWYPLDDWMGNLAIGCLAMDPNNANVMYAGTGEGFGNFDAISGEGIWKTTNGGGSWTQLTSTTGFGSINRIVVSPANSSIVIAATTGGIRRSTDGGTSWSTVRSGNSLQVALDPNNSNNLVGHVYDSGATTHRVVRSTNAGVTWTNAVSGLNTSAGRIELCYARSVANRIYASLDVSGGQVWLSNDGGSSWSQRTANGISSGQIWYNNSIWVDPTNSAHVVVGMVRIYRSTDFGSNFTTISNGGMNASTPHSDVHALVSDPGYDGSTNKVFYACTDGGVYRTSDLTTVTTSSGWSRRDYNYRTIQYHGVDGHSTGRIAGGTQDNGTHTLNFGSTTATLTAGNDGGYTAIDPTDPNYIFGETQDLYPFRSDNGGASATSIATGIADSGTCTNFIPPLVLDENNPNRLYAGGCNLWRTNNAKTGSPPTWVNVKSSTGSNISAIAVAPGNSNIVWVGHNNGTVYRTTNALSTPPTWTVVDNNGTTNPLPNRKITRILIDRTSTSRVFVCLGGFSTTNVQRTTNNGSTFADVTGSGVTGLPSAPVYGIAQHPTLNGRYYVATQVGAFGTSDDCATWSTGNDGPADVSCVEIRFLHGSSTLLLGTHGRGMWTTSIYEPGVATLGAGCAGSNGTPSLSATAPRLGQSVSVTASGLVANQPIWLVQGRSSTSWWGNSLPYHLITFGAPNCYLRTSADIVRDGLATSSGTLSTQLPIAAHTSLLGQSFNLQLFTFDPPANSWGHAASNALRLTIGN